MRLTWLPNGRLGLSRYPVAMTHPAPLPGKPRALIGWRLLALLYDFWPVLALWIAVPLATAIALGARRDR